MPLPQQTGVLGQKRAAHLLRRTTFGPTKTQIDTFANLTVADAVQQLFNTPLPDTPLPLDPLTGIDWITSPPASENNELQGYFKRWVVGLTLGVGSEDTTAIPYAFREKITFFLHTHFTTMESKVNSAHALYYQNALFRLYALDRENRTVEILNNDTGVTEPTEVVMNFKELTKKICVDNAMLKFLDGRLNVKGNPNENYAREMFELYTIGRGLEGTFSTPNEPGDYFTFKEMDVKAAARVLSGFEFDDTFTNLDPETGLPRGMVRGSSTNANQHVQGPKEFSEYFVAYNGGFVTPDSTLENSGQPTEESALDEISQLVELIYSREETARHICRKLYRFFVYYEIDQTLDDSIIAEMAQTFIDNNYKIQPVLEELLGSEHFYEAAAGVDDDNFGAIIKSPLDLIAGTLNFFEISPPDYHSETEAFYEFTGDLLDKMDKMGMRFYEPFEVAGYSAYHQFPIYNRNWISTNYLTQRYNFIQGIFLPIKEIPPLVSVRGYIDDNFKAVVNDAKQLVITLAPYIFSMADNLDFDTNGGELTKERIRYFLQAFLGLIDYEAEVDNGTAAWQALYDAGADYNQINASLTRLFNSMMQSPEYQLF